MPRENIQTSIVFDDLNAARIVCGPDEVNLRSLEGALHVRAGFRGDRLFLEGDSEDVTSAGEFMNDYYSLATRGLVKNERDFSRALELAAVGNGENRIGEIFSATALVTYKNQRITPRSVNQKAYLDSINANDIVFGIGPAGTGKTYLAVAAAVAALNSKRVNRIVLTRPAVEAGEKLGFLPGDLQEKINPYLRPLYDALYDMLSFEVVGRLIEKGTIEIAPLAFMRGRTFNDSFIILDEAQNASSAQMKMFLTRLGFDAKAVVTGDVTQIDLPGGTQSGLVESRYVLKNIDGIQFCEFREEDVVRHNLVRRIITAYDRHDAKRALRRKADSKEDDGNDRAE